jgi:hypothetical protein
MPGLNVLLHGMGGPFWGGSAVAFLRTGSRRRAQMPVFESQKILKKVLRSLRMSAKTATFLIILNNNE